LIARRSWVAIALGAAIALAGILSGRRASAIDHTFAATAQADYAFAPEDLQRPGVTAFDGATTELSMKLSADLSDHFSANVKVCFGCHGFETDMAYLDYRFGDELDIKLGRFSPSFGAFNIRHDPANHRLSDKPLPYDMGRMLRLRDWNLGVLPSPFPDNGLEISGTHWFGNRAQIDYATYAVSGFKGDYAGTDLDFVQSRSGSYYYVDNNDVPSFGGRLSLTLKLGENADLTLGASAMAGTFDPNHELWYVIFGGDATLRIHRTTLRMEWLARREGFDPDSVQLRYAVTDDNAFFLKQGAYVELEQPLTSRVDLIVRADGLLRLGDVPVNSPLDKESAVGRATLGVAVLVERHLRIKASTELWEFTDPDVNGVKTEVSFHLGAVGTF
jgi:hypothetical protein